MINYLFDVDGTLTPSRKPMVLDFKTYFKFWVRTQQSSGNKVYLVTGSDKDKTIEQVVKKYGRRLMAPTRTLVISYL